MKRLVSTFFFLVCALAIAFVGWYWWKSSADRANAARPVATRQLVVTQDGGAAENTGAAQPLADSTNKIGALPDEVVLSVESLNLDSDEGEEQILTVRKTGAQYSGLAIVVADWLADRKGWIRSWESRISVTKLTTLQIQARDIIGDHGLSIAVTGMNEKNEQTLSIFKASHGSEKTGLQYDEIADVNADTVFIDAVDRPESYQLAQTNGDPFRILSFTSDKDSANPLDQVRSTWVWDPKRNRYFSSGTDKIPGAQVEREIATKVLTGKESDFENFLRGVWYDAAYGPRDAKTRLLVFDPAGRSLTFFSGDSQEVFQWNESHSTHTGLFIGARNESVLTLRRLMDIEMTGADLISVRVFEDLLMKIDSTNRWDGSYRRFQGSSRDPAALRADPRLEGAWQGDGIDLSLAAAVYSLSRGSTVTRGRYMVYSVGKDLVIEFVEQRSSGPGSRSNYLVSLREAKDGTRFLRLDPVLPTINGLERKEEGRMDLSQKPRH